MWDAPLYSTTKVTLELRDIINNGENSIDIWGDNLPCLFHTDYINNIGMHEQDVRDLITNHFLFRQIGFETVGRFLHEWRQKTREIAPRYRNITYAQSLLWSQDDPLESYHLTETFTEKNEGTSTGESTGTSTGSGSSNTSSETTTSDSESGSKKITGNVTESKKHLFSDTPQGNIENVGNHMSNASIDDNTSSNTDNETTTREGNGSSSTETSSSDTSTATSTSTSEASAESTITRTLERRGNIGVQPLGDEVRKYQEAFDDIIAMIIREYEPLFLRVY